MITFIQVIRFFVSCTIISVSYTHLDVSKRQVEAQPTEEANEDTVDNEVQEDFSEESEEENPESSLENEDYPGEDVVEIINLQRETTAVYKLVDGRYMDCTNTVYIYDGKDTWTDTNGVEWNREVK